MNNLAGPEKKFFEFSVLGILASRTAMEHEYNIKLSSSETIAEVFINKENIDKVTFDQYSEKHQNEIDRIRNLATEERKKGFNGRVNFLKWYLSKEKVCCYCGVKENDLEKYFNDANMQYKNARQRGKKLEIERIITAPPSQNRYTEANTDLACYVCNNAKSDFISAKAFKEIAKGINKFWAKNKIEAVFPEKSSIWNQ